MAFGEQGKFQLLQECLHMQQGGESFFKETRAQKPDTRKEKDKRKKCFLCFAL